MPLLTIDNREVEVPDGTTILSAARKIGIEIPVFCYHDGLSVAGNCRMCLVEVVGNSKPVASCEAVASEGMVVETQSSLALAARRSTLEFVLANHPVDCPVCDCAGECVLQEHYFDHSAQPSRITVRKVHKDKRLVIGPQVILDKERCINCTRCVRFCQEVSKTNQLVQVERGESTEITTFPGQEFTDPYSLCTVDLCPVGALTSSDFRFKKRVWWLQQTSSICPECERGCALTVDHADNSMFRLRPRYEPQVNNWWACDYGRLSYHKYSSDRIISGHFGLRTHEELSSSPADAAVAGGRWLREAATGSGRVGVWIDSCLSLEEGFAALSFAQRFAETSQVHLAQRASGSGDHLLRLPGEASNGRGLKVLAQHMGIELLSADNLFGAQQQWSALLGFGAEIELPRPSSPEQVGRVMLFAWRHNHVTKVAHTLVPIAGHFEKAGHYVNSQGIVQQAEAAVAPPAGVVSLATLLHAIASDHGIALDYRDETEAQSKALAAVNGEGGANG